MPRELVVPCPVCGYHAPESECPHCRGAPREPSLVRTSAGVGRDLAAGLAAFLHGLRVLLLTPRTKRLLVPPLVLTGALFVAVLVWLIHALERFLDAVREHAVTGIGGPEWLRSALAWLAGAKVVVWIAHAAGWIVALGAFAIAALWTFSIAYEAICGPFLDAIQGRVEARWFGRDPRETLAPPPLVDERRKLAWLTGCFLACGAIVVAFFALESGWSWLLPLALPAPFLTAGALDRPFGRWLAREARLQSSTLWTSVKASLLAALVLVVFLPVKLVPVAGLPLFAMIAGFATALTLLDIPFSRRDWTLRQRLDFLGRHAPAVVALGVVTSLVFVVPLVGPLVGVPAASIGGQWLLVRLDKSKLRERALRGR